MTSALDAAIAHTDHERGEATRFYRWALVSVLVGVLCMIGIGIYVAVSVNAINARGGRNETVQLCEANAEGVIARDVHNLIAHNGGGSSTLYVIPKVCVAPKDPK